MIYGPTAMYCRCIFFLGSQVSLPNRDIVRAVSQVGAVGGPGLLCYRQPLKHVVLECVMVPTKVEHARLQFEGAAVCLYRCQAGRSMDLGMRSR